MHISIWKLKAGKADFGHFSEKSLSQIFGTLFASIFCSGALFLVLFEKVSIKFGASLASKFEKNIQKQHLLMRLFGTNIAINLLLIQNQNKKKINTETAPNNGAIWDEFSTKEL